MQTTKISRTTLTEIKKGVLAALGLRRARIEYGTRMAGEHATPNFLVWDADSDLVGMWELTDLTSADLAGKVGLDLYIYSATDGDLLGNMDAFFHDGRFVGVADPFTQPTRHTALRAALGLPPMDPA